MCHFTFEAYCGFNWNDNEEFWYELDPDMEMGDDWLESMKKVPNPNYDPDKLPREQPEFCTKPGELCYGCWKNDCPFLFMCPVDEPEYDKC